MISLDDLIAISLVISILTAAGIFVWFVVERIIESRVQRKFIRDIAINHLPHIYDGLHKLCGQAGIQLECPPAIQFINGKTGSVKED